MRARHLSRHLSSMLGALLLGSSTLLGCSIGGDEPDVASAVRSPVPHPPQTYLLPGRTALPLEMPEPQVPELDYAKLNPGPWELVPAKPMRLANYRVPKAEGDPEDAEVSVAIAGGDIEANITRWTKQFEGTPEVKRSSKEIRPIKLTHVEINGTYAPGGMQGGDKPAGKPNSTMLGEIIELPGIGFFIKFVGPTNTIRANKDAYDKFLLATITSLMGGPRPQ